MLLAGIGAVCFGIVVGWVTHRTIIRKTTDAALTDIAAVLGSIGGAVVTGLYGEPEAFGAYAIGLLVGFFAYLITFKNAGGDLAGNMGE